MINIKKNSFIVFNAILRVIIIGNIQNNPAIIFIGFFGPKRKTRLLTLKYFVFVLGHQYVLINMREKLCYIFLKTHLKAKKKHYFSINDYIWVQ